MSGFVEGEPREQLSMLPASLDEYVHDENPVRVVDAFIEELDLAAMGFDGVQPAATGRPAYHPSTLLKIYLYGYLNRIQSSRRLEREANRNVELMWLTGRLAPDFKTIADFRKDNGPAIQAACTQFIAICSELGLFAHAVAAIDGAKFKRSTRAIATSPGASSSGVWSKLRRASSAICNRSMQPTFRRVSAPRQRRRA
jgi:transposase